MRWFTSAARADFLATQFARAGQGGLSDLMSRCAEVFARAVGGSQ